MTVKKAGLYFADCCKAYASVNMGVERIWNLCESQSDKQNLGGVPASLGVHPRRKAKTLMQTTHKGVSAASLLLGECSRASSGTPMSYGGKCS